MFRHFSVTCFFFQKTYVTTQRFSFKFDMFTACDERINNCDECSQEESTIMCTRCGDEYYTFDGSDCTGEHQCWGQSILCSHIHVF